MGEIHELADARKSTLEWALEYAARGVKLFSTTADGKAPNISNKQWSQHLGKEVSKGTGGLHMATTDPETIRWMFSQRGAGGIAMPCGAVNGVIVLDMDIHKEAPDGPAHRVRREFWDELQEAHMVTTRNGGEHYYFEWEPGHLKGELGPNIDVQSDGSYVLLPPSKGYRVKRQVMREDWATPPWRATAIDRSVADEGGGEISPHIKLMARRISNGDGWWNEVRDVVAHMVGAGYSDAEILRYSFQWTTGGHSPRETFEQVYQFIQSARHKGWGQ